MASFMETVDQSSQIFCERYQERTKNGIKTRTVPKQERYQNNNGTMNCHSPRPDWIEIKAN